MLHFSVTSFSQNVSIPDTAFLNALIRIGLDTNRDSIISYEEVSMVKYLPLGDWSTKGKISDLTGIEAFVNLSSLSCFNNRIKNLDVSKNGSLVKLSCSQNYIDSLNVSTPSLEHLYCDDNQLTSLDISDCSLLIDILCNNNQLTSLDISNNPMLWILNCANNRLTSLDVSSNVGLADLDCSGNLLTKLDISNNRRLMTWLYGDYQGCISIQNMPSLEKVCVWTMPFPPNGQACVSTSGSPNVFFTTGCATGILPDAETPELSIYPNPGSGSISIDIPEFFGILRRVNIYNISGNLMGTKELHQFDSPTLTINLNELSVFQNGIYIIELVTSLNIYEGKLLIDLNTKVNPLYGRY